MNANDIAAHHRSRLAFIYVRQSSPHQVLHHRESQLRQRSFRQRAADLGWPLERITVIDEDLGVSATKRRQERTGFQNMVAEAALGHVGIILALELSRLSRTNQDWYHLLDICAVTGTLLADEEALYDPRAYNDRLLLGLKGTMSEAEIHIMKQRLVEAMHAKAKRGEFCFRLPSGYEWDEANRMVKTADEQVRSAIELVFARFEQWGTIHRVQSSMVEDGLQVPIMSGPRARLRWGRPDYAHLRRMLTHPIYAGRLLLWAAPSGRVSGCGSAPSQTNERSTATAMARIDSGSSRTIRVVGEIRAHPAADRIQSPKFTGTRCAARRTGTVARTDPLRAVWPADESAL